MEHAFAIAKIQPPRARGDLVRRPALEEALARALATRRIVALVAPAGFGKTVALAGGLGLLGDGFARTWLTCDADDDAARALACLVAALEPYDLPWRTAPEALVAGAAGDTTARTAALAAFVNTLAAADVPHGVLVFDDLHQWRDPAALDWLGQLLDWLPPRWTVALATRTATRLPLARWRARGELADFGVAALRFSPDDVAALLGSTPGDSRVQELLAGTDGWAAGLRLSLASDGAAAWPRQRITDFLASEVFEALPDELRSFLLRTAVLPELTAARAAAVSGNARAAMWLDEIERRGLFASPLEGEERTLRLHDLFRDFLLERLRREAPGEERDLVVRAASTEADPARRVAWLLRADAFGEAQQALCQAAGPLLASGADGPLLRLWEQFPAEQRRRSPLLAYVRGLAALPRFEWITMQSMLRSAAAGLGALGMEGAARYAAVLEVVALTTCGRLDEAAERLATLREMPLERDTAAVAELMAYWASGARGPRAEPAGHLQRMTDLLITGATPRAWIGCTPHFMFLGRPGVHAALQRWAGQALAVAGDAHPMLRAAGHSLAAWAELWRGRVAAATALIENADADLRWLGHPRGLHLLSIACHGACHALRGEREPLNAAFDRLLDDVERDPERRATWRGTYLVLGAHCAAATGDWERVGRLADALELTAPEREWPYTQAARQALRARIALHDGRASPALDGLQRAIAALDDVDMLGTAATYRAVLAQAWLREHRPADAWHALSPALREAGSSGETAPLLLAGAEVLEDLSTSRFEGEADAASLAVLRDLRAEARALREATSAPRTATAPGGVDGGGALDDPAGAASALSPREIEVLGQIANGLSNKQIARSLEVSPYTVKRHVANILDKLALGSRGQAAAWYLGRGRR